MIIVIEITKTTLINYFRQTDCFDRKEQVHVELNKVIQHSIPYGAGKCTQQTHVQLT